MIKNIIIFSFFILVGFVGKAQTNLDSLWNVWEDDTKLDTVRLEALYQFNSLGYMHSNPSRAVLVANKGFDFAKEKRKYAYCVNFIIQKGRLSILHSEFDDANRYFKKGMEISDSINYSFGYFNSYFNIGTVFFRRGEFEKAIRNFEKCLDLTTNEKVPEFKEGRAGVFLNLGAVYANMGKLDVALDYFSASIVVFKEMGKKKHVAGIYNNMGVIAKAKANYELAIIYFNKSLAINKELNIPKEICNGYLNLGGIYYILGKEAKAFEYYNKGLKLAKESQNKGVELKLYSNLATLYSARGDNQKAINYYKLLIKSYIKNKDLDDLAIIYKSIGSVYENQSENKIALGYYLKALDISKEIKNMKILSNTYGGIASIYLKNKNYKKAFDFYRKSIATQRKNNLKEDMVATLVNLSEAYIEYLNVDSSSIEINKEIDSREIEMNRSFMIAEVENMLEESLSISLKSGGKDIQVRILLGMGKLALEKRELNKALKKGESAYKLSLELNEVQLRMNVSNFLYMRYKESKSYKKAFEMQEVYIKFRDSLQNKENQKALIQYEYRSQYEKQAAADSIEYLKAKKIKEVQIAKQEAELKSKRMQQYALFGGLGLVVLFALFMLKKNKQIQQQKKEIEIQKNVAEEQQQIAENQKIEIAQQHEELEEVYEDLTDSIRYAKRLQASMLPPFETLNKISENNFILFLPKDVVSGDFYWSEHKNDVQFLAVADSTGHGVPGAMVSVVCSSALNRSVKEFGITEPSKLLDKTRELVVETFAKSGEEIKDGMDISLCAFKDGKVFFSGANNPLWIVRRTKFLTKEQKEERSSVIGIDFSLIEYKGDRQSISLLDEMCDFSQQEIELKEGDNLYLFSDGYADQFGGENGKKYKYRPFKRLLIEIQDKSMNEQYLILNETFSNWKRDLEQVDDVCVIGINFKES